MNLFDSLVDAALASRPALAQLRPVVEKEILHHDILREMAEADLLKSLTFIGGTCLRACYGSERLSEDLDFTGGADFRHEQLSSLGLTIASRLYGKYGIEVKVSDPVKETGNVDTWKIRISTNQGKPHLPAQRINIDICAIPSHDVKPAMLRNHYGVDMGTSGLILFAESREEILADKVVALALRPNRVKNRDLWDIVWLARQGIRLDDDLVRTKLQDRSADAKEFHEKLVERIAGLTDGLDEYRFEIRRFIPKAAGLDALEKPGYWDALLSMIRLACNV